LLVGSTREVWQLVGSTSNGSGANVLELVEIELVLAAGVETTGVLAAGVELAEVVAVLEVFVVDATGVDGGVVVVVVEDAAGTGGLDEVELLAEAVKTGAGGAAGIELVELVLEFAVELAEVAVLEEDAFVGVGGETGGVGELDVGEGGAGGTGLDALAAVGEGGGEVFSLLTVTVNCKSRSPS